MSGISGLHNQSPVKMYYGSSSVAAHPPLLKTPPRTLLNTPPVPPPFAPRKTLPGLPLEAPPSTLRLTSWTEFGAPFRMRFDATLRERDRLDAELTRMTMLGMRPLFSNFSNVTIFL